MSDYGDYNMGNVDDSSTSTNRELNAQGWSGSANLATGNASQAAALQASFDEAAVYTLQFYISPPAAINTAQGMLVPNVRPVASVVWAVQGNQTIRQFDVGDGTTVSGAGQAVSVQVQDQTMTGALFPAGQNYTVSVVCVKGVRADTNQPVTLYGGTGDIAPLNTVTINVPFGGVIGIEVDYVDTTTITTNPIFATVQFFAGVTEVYSYAPTARPGVIPVPPNTSQIVFNNPSATDTISYSYFWAIDG